MKNIKLLSAFLFLLIYTTSDAQVAESERSMAAGVYPALSIVIPDTDDKDVEKWWKDYMKDMGAKPKKVKKADEVLSEGFKDVEINGVTPINVYARTEESGNDAEQIVWFELGEGKYLQTGDSTAYIAGEKFMMRFGLYVTKRNTEIELKEEEKTLKNFDKDLAGLLKDNDNYHSKIEDAKKLIAEMEANIEQNLKDQESKNKEIVLQRAVIEEVKKRLAEL